MFYYSQWKGTNTCCTPIQLFCNYYTSNSHIYYNILYEQLMFVRITAIGCTRQHCVPESPKWSKMVLKLLVWIFMLSWMSIKHRQSKKKSNDRFLNKSTFIIYYCQHSPTLVALLLDAGTLNCYKIPLRSKSVNLRHLEWSQRGHL